MFKLESDITLLLVACISLLRCEVQATGQHIRFRLLAPRAICDVKLELRQGQCPPSLESIQNTSCHVILQVFMAEYIVILS